MTIGKKHFLLVFIAFVLTIVNCAQKESSQRGKMIEIPAGWFLMGHDDGARANQPQREVFLDAFAIDHTEVTNAAFAEFLKETKYPLKREWETEIPAEQANLPVIGVLWAEADAYCRWAGKRLPTEAEWEKAARGTDGRLYPWDSVWDAAKANTWESGIGSVIAVGSYPEGTSPYGVLDMAGNASEWVADYFDFNYYQDAPSHNPTGPTKIMDHSLRGGSWAAPAENAQTFFRDSSHSVRPNMRVGFRCAVSLDE
jgi:formylglycine-generating enzyme required for sulfatase activity